MAANTDWCRLLLQAADVIESRDRAIEGIDHGYAATSAPPGPRTRKSKNGNSPLSRNMHNELEKCRRANMRQYFERLKELVPRSSHSSKCTMLGLLKQTRCVILDMQAAGERQTVERDQQCRHHQYLQRRLEELRQGRYRDRVAESSPVSTNSTSSSPSSACSEFGDIDVTSCVIESISGDEDVEVEDDDDIVSSYRKI